MSKRRFVVLALSALVIAAALFGFLSVYSPKQAQQSVGICGGFGTKPVKEIPTAVIQAASKYLKTDMAVGVLSYATTVDPVRESSVPHRCLGVRDDISPYSMDQLLTIEKI